MVDERARLISEQERIAIWDAYLEHGSYLATSKAVNRDRETIARHIKTDAFEAYAAAHRDSMAQQIAGSLLNKAPKVLDHWARAADIAADKGDHKPAKDWLIAAKLIDPDPTNASTQQNVVIVGLQGKPALDDPFAHDAVITVTQPTHGQTDSERETGAIDCALAAPRALKAEILSSQSYKDSDDAAIDAERGICQETL